MPQYTVQLGDALDAFKGVIAALTYPTSAQAVFPTTAILQPGQEFKVAKIYPQAVIRVMGGELDDENEMVCHKFNISVEIRVRREAMDDGESALYGTNRTSDQALGAGLVDMLVKLIAGAGQLSPQDNSEFLQYFHYRGFSALTPTDQHSAWSCNFEAYLNLT